MIIHDVGQGSIDWLRLRLGIPTASDFSSIITPTGKPSAQAEEYANYLLAEKMLGYQVEDFTGTKWTERGQEIEHNAVHYYEFQNSINVQKVGFVTDDGHTMGCSPDRLIGDDGLLEIKCLKANTHVGMLLSQTPDPKHKPQLQGQLYITGRQWMDIEYFHPELSSLIVRVGRDEPYIALMSELIDTFTSRLSEKKLRLVELGYLI